MENLEIEAELQWSETALKGLKTIPDDILYTMARETLDRSYNLIPMSNIPNHAGTLRRSSVGAGVRGGNGDYYIGSYTAYASRVWNMKESTNWTTPGTNNKWFARGLKLHQANIINTAIDKSWKKDML